MKKIILAIVILLTCSGISCGLTAQELRWDLKSGDQFAVEFDQQSSTSTTVDKRTTRMECATTITMDWTIKEIDSQRNAVIEQSLAAIRISVGDPAVPDQKLTLDTDSKAKPTRDAAKVLKQVLPLVGVKWILTMSPRGEILEVQLPTESELAIRKTPSELRLPELFSQAGVEQFLTAATFVLPESMPAVGEVWQSPEPISSSFGVTNRVRNYTFRGINTDANRKLATLEFSAFNDAEEAAANSVAFDETGEMTFDVDAGYFVTSEVRSMTKSAVPYRESKIETKIENLERMTVSRK